MLTGFATPRYIFTSPAAHLTSTRMTTPANMPFNVAALGYAGLLPPALLLILDKLLFGNHPPILSAFVPVYAALVFSFLGGCWWTFALREDKPSTTLLVMGVLPTILCFGLIWAAYVLGPVPATLILASLIALSPLADALLNIPSLVPQWWIRLRFHLSMGLAALTALSVYRAL
ncbi:DUF3429 domain-containing protein [Sphingomonas sp.]|uniref:DUF3429 domain-containing protein n=1 Tax=Sphingomonas sp. TaxID=28214 RepID=UPI00286AAD09|nr:DUF3429 domain-containing protein [Sphingomonas sp.]